MKIGILIFALANVLAWFQLNSQFVWEPLKDRPILVNLVLAFPTGLCFWYAIRHIVEDTGQLWTSKMVGFGVGNVVFGLLTWVLLKESAFTTKTMTCLALGVLIILIQIYWK